jgi:hypothetical protein
MGQQVGCLQQEGCTTASSPCRQNSRYLLQRGQVVAANSRLRGKTRRVTCDIARISREILITVALSKLAPNFQQNIASFFFLSTRTAMADSTSMARCCSSHVLVLLLILPSILIGTIGFGNQPLSDAVSKKLKIQIKSQHGNQAPAATIATIATATATTPTEITWRKVLLEEKSLHQLQILENY